MDDGAGGIVEQSIKFPVWFEPELLVALRCVRQLRWPPESWWPGATLI